MRFAAFFQHGLGQLLEFRKQKLLWVFLWQIWAVLTVVGRECRGCQLARPKGASEFDVSFLRTGDREIICRCHIEMQSLAIRSRSSFWHPFEAGLPLLFCTFATVPPSEHKFVSEQLEVGNVSLYSTHGNAEGCCKCLIEICELKGRSKKQFVVPQCPP